MIDKKQQTSQWEQQPLVESLPLGISPVHIHTRVPTG